MRQPASGIWAEIGLEKEIGGLEKAIKKRYLTVNVFVWGAVIFGLGILLSFISIFMKE